MSKTTEDVASISTPANTASQTPPSVNRMWTQEVLLMFQQLGRQITHRAYQ